MFRRDARAMCAGVIGPLLMIVIIIVYQSLVVGVVTKESPITFTSARQIVAEEAGVGEGKGGMAGWQSGEGGGKGEGTEGRGGRAYRIGGGYPVLIAMASQGRAEKHHKS